MKSTEEKLIEALESYVALRETEEAWAAEFKKGSREMLQNFMSPNSPNMATIGRLREYSAEKGRQSKVLSESVENRTRDAKERATRLIDAHSARASALARLDEALTEPE